MDNNYRNFILNQIESYNSSVPLYKHYYKILKKLLHHFIGGYSSNYMIKGGIKNIYDFTNELSNFELGSNPLEEMTDLCILNVLLPNLNQLSPICDIIKKKEGPFNVVEERGILELYEIKEFVIQLNFPHSLYEQLELNVSDEILNLKAKIQVYSFLQFSKEVNQYEMLNMITPIKNFTSEMDKISAMLEKADESLEILKKQMETYESTYGFYLSKEIIKKKIDLLKIVYENKKDIEIANEIGKLAIKIGDWDFAINTLEDVIKTSEWKKAPEIIAARILRKLGIATCKKFEDFPVSQGFKNGQNYLIKTTERNPKDADACASLGGTFKKQNNLREAYKWYKRALKVDLDDPYPLVNYLITKICITLDYKEIKKRKKHMIRKAIEIRKNQIDARVDFPWPFFDIGLFNLLLGNVRESLLNYLNGIRFSSDMWMIETTYNTLDEIQFLQGQIEGFDLICSLLLLGMAFHPYKIIAKTYLERLNEFFDIRERNLDQSVIIVAGGTDDDIEGEMQRNKNNIIKGFKDFDGTIISGGTHSGICGIVGDIQELQEKYIELNQDIREKINDAIETREDNVSLRMLVRNTIPQLSNEDFEYLISFIVNGVEAINLDQIVRLTDGVRVNFPDVKGNLRTIGYLPSLNPHNIKSDERYSIIHSTKGTDFSILETLQYWYDIFKAGINPKDVKLIGINGGDISALEYRIAIVFGADVGIIEDSGREADKLVNSPMWEGTFSKVKNSSEAINNFITIPFIADHDIKNLKAFIIQSNESVIYIKEFSKVKRDLILTSGYLTFLIDFAGELGFEEEEMKEVYHENFNTVMTSFREKDYRIYFILWNKATSSLKQKIVEATRECEDQLGDIFRRLRPGRGFEDHNAMAIILSRVFGSEIKKFFV